MRRRPMLVVFVLCLALCLGVAGPAIGCGGTETEATATPESTLEADSHDASPEPPSVEPGMLCLYFMDWTAAKTTSLGQHGEVSEHEGGIFRFVPALGDLSEMSSFFYSSLGYRSSQRPYTVGGRLFVVNVSESGSASFRELNPVSKASIGQAVSVKTRSEYTGWSSFAIVGNRVYYKEAREWDYMYGYSGGSFKMKELDSDKSAELLLGHSHSQNYGALYAVGEQLFRVDTFEDMSTLVVNRIDLSTGEIEKQLQFSLGSEESGVDNFSTTLYFSDQNALYRASQMKDPIEDASGQPIYLIALWRLTSADFEEDKGFQYIEALPILEGELAAADADDGCVVLQMRLDSGNHFIVYECATGSISDSYLPWGIQSGDAQSANDVYYMQVLIARSS